jgi:Zn-dependent M28 family amino/carboxypeptidase
MKVLTVTLALIIASPTFAEKGLLGSEYYASHPVYPLERTVAVINLDQP